MVRRVARFDASVVCSAIEANAPNKIVLNHLDYVDSSCRTTHCLSQKAEQFVNSVERKIRTSIDFVGFGPSGIVPRVHGSSASESPAHIVR